MKAMKAGPFEQFVDQTTCMFCKLDLKDGDYIIMLTDGPIHFSCYIIKTSPYKKCLTSL